MATVQQFIHWLKREKSKGGCIKMAAPEMNPSHDSSDDSYGMNRLLKQEVTASKIETSHSTKTESSFTENEKLTEKSTAAKMETFNTSRENQNEMFLDQLSFSSNSVAGSASCRASMKLPPIPREEARTRWMPLSHRRVCADSPAHIYEEIPWSAVETDYEDGPDNNANRKKQTDRNVSTGLKSGKTNVVLNEGCEPYLVVQLTKGQTQKGASDNQNTQCAKTDIKSTLSSADCVAMDTNCTDNLLSEDGLEKYAGNFTQCTKCNRPHGLFNGTQIKHFDDHNEHGDTDMCTFDRLSVRSRSLGKVQGKGNSNTKTTHGFHREVPSNKFGPKVRTNPRVSERNFKFARGTSLDSSNPANQSMSSDNSSQQIGTGVKVQESDSADTCNEYDIHTGSEHSNRMSGKSSTSGGSRSSIASDSAASNLYGSESSNDSLKSHSRRQLSRERSKLNESDSSNDTFSEYDIRSSDSYSSSKGLADEYDFYLSKIRQNLMLKHETLRVIRESESSEYETSEYLSSSMGSSVYTSSDVSVMTSLGNHDVSNCSAFNENRDVKIKGILKNNRSCPALQNRPKRSIVIKDDGSKSRSSAHVSNPSVHARKKPNRRKSTGAIPSTLECYTLPDFASESTSTVPDGGIRGRSNSPAADSSILDTSAISSGNESDLLDKLSCRVTNYKPGTPPLVTSSGSSVSSLGGGASAFTKVSGTSKVTVPKVTASQVSRAPAHRHAQSRPQHNRLLTDIMKLNHDRQLLFL